MSDRKLLIYVEIDQKFCANTYGTSPCTASIPTTGAAKCWNSVLTCQDRANFIDAPVTLRFAKKDCDYLPNDIEAIPSIEGVSVSPGIISLGEDLGLRAEMKVMLRDHRSPDTGPGGDPYLADRTGDPFTKGTYWGKWRARVRYLRGQPIRLIIGELGTALEDMETRHYVVESVDGPDANGSVTITAKDPLKLADGDRAQAPALSRGYLQADISDSATSITLAPSGIGAEYPAAGYVAIGGAEIVSFTRSSDTLTITRAQLGTEAQAHSAEDRVQVVLRYVGQSPAVIIHDLLTEYAGIDPDYITLADWNEEVDAYLGRVFSANIAEPTDVSKLVSELIQQAALSIWWDEIARQIKLRVLRQISTDAETFTPEIIVRDSFRSREQPDKRVSQAWIFYGQRNPLKKLDEEENYRSVAVGIDADAEADYAVPAIKKIYSRWIAAFGRSSAERTGALILGRYRDPPRRFNWALFRDQADEVVAGSGYQIEWWNLQNTEGEQEAVPIQITRMAPDPDGGFVGFEAEEANYANVEPIDLDNRVITIDTNTTDFNLRSAHDLIYPAPETDDTFNLRVIIESTAIVGGSVLGSPAFTVGDWPTGVTIDIINNGRIQGRGGAGGRGWSSDGNTPSTAGEAGSTALYTRKAITVDNTLGRILGGGGGGGGGGMSSWASNRESGAGGGGQGFRPGAAGEGTVTAKLSTAATAGTIDARGTGGNGANGTNNRGGNGGTSGNGGSAGTQVSASFPAKAGGAGGRAIDGVSYITFDATGIITGAQVN